MSELVPWALLGILSVAELFWVWRLRQLHTDHVKAARDVERARCSVELLEHAAEALDRGAVGESAVLVRASNRIHPSRPLVPVIARGRA